MTNRNFRTILVLFMAASIIYSCNNHSGKTRQAHASDGRSTQISPGWHGTYSGFLPCADCDRIETELTLNDDFTYVLVNSYLKGEESFTDTLLGKFTLKGSRIKLQGIPKNEGPPWFKVEEGQVRYLDMKGRIIKGELENHYIMRKNGNPLVEDRKWQIVEIYGKPVEGTADNYYMIFNSREGRISAKVNCNILNYSYKIKNELQVRFGQGMSTLMACPDNLEDEFKEILELADNLSTDGKYLSLNKARMAPLARLILAE